MEIINHFFLVTYFCAILSKVDYVRSALTLLMGRVYDLVATIEPTIALLGNDTFFLASSVPLMG